MPNFLRDEGQAVAIFFKDMLYAGNMVLYMAGPVKGKMQFDHMGHAITPDPELRQIEHYISIYDINAGQRNRSIFSRQV